MDLRTLIESLVRQKMAESGNALSSEALTNQIIESLGQKGIQVEEQLSTKTNRPPPNPSQQKTIAIGSDHGGFELKQILCEFIKSLGYQINDVGTFSEEAVDYPDLAEKVSEQVAQGITPFGIIIDGAGIGSSMAANKVPGVRAAHCHNTFEARNSKEHNNANVLSLGGRVIGSEFAKAIVKTWLTTDFAGGRHQKRVDKIMAIERKHLRS